MKLSRKERASWSFFVHRLRTILPTSRPVRIRTRPDLDRRCEGVCLFYASHYQLVISIALDYYGRIAVLEHEYAHVLDYERNGFWGRNEHRASWGQEFARVHSVMVRLFDEQEERGFL